MEAIQKCVEQIFTEYSVLTVPIFQRNYSWKKDEWEQLWNDIGEGKDQNKHHYLGSIVLVKNKGTVIMIDGQQRLTTISIVLKSIEWCFRQLIKQGINVDDSKERATYISRLIYDKNIYDLSKVVNKIRMNDTNNEVYSRYIMKDIDINSDEITSESNRLLLSCYIYFKQVISSTCLNEDGTLNQVKLLDYYTYISKNIDIVEIMADNYDDAYVIFETMNDRGVVLSPADLLKNYLFSKTPEGDHAEVIKIWNRIINQVGEKELLKFIRHYWISRNKKILARELFKAIKNYINEGRDIKEFLYELEQGAIIYRAISEPNNPMWKNNKHIEKYLSEIKLFKVDLCYPVLLATQLNISDNQLKINLFKLCSRISFRYIVIGNGAQNDLENAYNKLCLSIIERKNNLDFEKIKVDMKEFIVSDETFKTAFSEKVLKSRQNKALIKYILRCIEKNLGGDIGDDQSIEHILPEHPDDKWESLFENESGSYIYRLGNYTLLKTKENNDLGSAPFNEKRLVYKNSKYIITQKIASKTEWTKESIEDRQRAMADTANAVWNI